ncbi:hypothetical protein [Cupriavidus gilardii]|uniref:hypothetical protein n=1 Tax=Cupriavidus gilardii TaxID=82541 RepID=UPI001571B280|nr:hypothetical protein [Cupriavidus gilardii]NSX02671.1 hypothetical protein [Cupriavidus gilardii]
MSANITFLVYRLEWHRRRAEALHAARSGLYRQFGDQPSCKIYWAADSFAHRNTTAVRAPDWRDPCTIADPQTEPD